MYEEFFMNFGMGASPFFIFVSFALAAWVIIWKGLGLWNSARNRQKIWFVFMLVLNTFGILPIIYLAFFKKKKNVKVKTKKKAKRKKKK